MEEIEVRLLVMGNDHYSATVTCRGHHEGGVDFSASSQQKAVRYAKDLGKAVAKGYGMHQAIVRVKVRDLTRV